MPKARFRPPPLNCCGFAGCEIERTRRLDGLGTVTVTEAALIYANAHIARTAFMATDCRIDAHQTGTPHSHERVSHDAIQRRIENCPLCATFSVS
jgi:hypothetical protein